MEFKMPELPAGTKPFCLGALAGAAIIVWTGFDALGWKLNSTAEALAKKKAEAAVVSAYASICRAQFSTGADFSARLAALAKVDRYSRGELVAKGGWATMSGAKEPQYGVAQECAELLVPEKT